MKHSIVAGTIVCAALPAFAQNSVTLYGLIDEGFGLTNNVNGGKAWQFQSGRVAGSRWGLKGVEDLGGGNSAIFTLEAGFDINTGKLGQGGRGFGRQAFVGLQNRSLGTVTLGRQYDSVVTYLAPLTSNGGTTGFIFAHPLDNDNTDNTFRTNNSVKFASQNLAGVRFGGMYSFSNSPGQFSNNNAFSAGASYTNEQLAVAAAYMRVNHPGESAVGALASDESSFVADQYQTFGAAVNYTYQKFTGGFAYTHTSLNSPKSSVYVGAFSVIPNRLTFDNMEVNGKYRITPALLVAAMYTYTQGKFDASTENVKLKWHQVGMHVDYALSKQTVLYAQGVYQRLVGGDTGTVLDNAFIPGSTGVSSTATQVVGRVGIRHAF